MKIKRCVSFWLCLLFCAALFAQESFPFTLHKKLDMGLTASGVLLSSVGYFSEKNLAPFEAQDIQNLNKADIKPAFDRSTTTYWSPEAQKASDVALATSGLSALTLTLWQVPKRKNWFILGLMGAETALLTYGLTSNTKVLVARPRPFTYNSTVDLAEKLSTDARQSFFSGHTSMAAAACVFSAEVFATMHPDSPWKPWVRTGSFVLPAAVGVLRVRGGKHFPSDVLTGYAVGALIGWAVPRLHRIEQTKISLFPTPTGAGLVWVLP